MIIRKVLALGVVAIVLQADAYAATPKVSAADEAKSVTTIAKDLLNKERNTVLGYRAIYKEFETNAARFEAIRTTILSDRTAAQESKDARALELRNAIQDRTEIQTLQLISPHIVPLNQGLLSLVGIYKGQACAPGGSLPLCIGGAWSRLRNAMGSIIDSQAADLQAIETFGDGSSSVINSIILDLELMGSDEPNGLLEFGLSHYTNNTAVALQTLLTTTSELAPMFDGRNLEGQASQRVLPCLIGQTIPLTDFKSELQSIKAAATLYSGDHEGFVHYLEGAAHYYDGADGEPGVLSHWNGCIDSKQLQINTLQVSLNQARADGDIQSAANFHTTINSLTQDILKLRAEEKILQLRRNQIGALQNTQAILFDSENEADTTWVSGVSAHADDLISGMVVYPNALRAMRALILAAQPQLALLSNPSGPQDLKDKALQLASYYHTVLGDTGYERIKIELSFAGRTVFPNLAQAIRIGQSALTANIQTFEDILAQTAAFSLAEQLGLPARLTQANQAIAVAQANFNAAAAFVEELAAALSAHDASMQAISQAGATLESLFGIARFNPLYSDMANLFTNSLRTDKRYKGAGTKIQSSMKSYLKSFNGLTPGSAKGITCLNKKGVCASTLVRKASVRRDELVASLGAQLDIIGRPYLNGQTISQLVAGIVANRASILSREH